MKNVMKRTDLSYVIGISLLISTPLWAGDVEVSLPTATDAFTVDQPAGTELMRVHGDGNVGIGVVSPEATLHISNTEPSILIQDTNALATDLAKVGFIHFRDSAGDTTGFIGDGSGATNDMQISAGVNQQLRFYTNGTSGIDSQKMIINTEGNVGVGTSNLKADAKLTLEDGVGSGWESRYEFRNGYAWQTVASNSATGGEPRFMFARNRGTLAAPTVNQNGDLMGQLEFRAYDGGVHRRGASILGLVDGNVSSSNMPAALYFRTEAEGGSDLENRMVIKNNGNVGIGTTTPAAKLDVAGTVRSTANYFSPISGLDGAAFYAKSENPAFALLDTNAPNGWYIEAWSTGDLTFNTDDEVGPNRAEHIRFKNDGSVGIGTDAPTEKLEINGNIKIGATIKSDNEIYLNPSANSDGFKLTGSPNISTLVGNHNQLIIGTERTNTASEDDVIFQYTDSAKSFEWMRLDAATGNIGIGASSPTHPLELASGAHVTSAGVWTDASDIAKKENIKEINYGLDTVMKLKPSEYNYKIDGSRSIGFIAQEIEKIIPEVVSGEDGSKGVAYGALTAVLTKAMQQQQKQIEHLQELIDAQKKRIETLESQKK